MEAVAQAAATGQAVQPGPKTPGDNLVANTPLGHVLDQAPLALTEKVVPAPSSNTDLTVALVARLDTTFYGYGYATVFLESTKVTTVVTVFLFFNISLVFRPNLMIRTPLESPRKELSNGVLIIENDLEMTEIRSFKIWFGHRLDNPA